MLHLLCAIKTKFFLKMLLIWETWSRMWHCGTLRFHSHKAPIGWTQQGAAAAPAALHSSLRQRRARGHGTSSGTASPSLTAPAAPCGTELSPELLFFGRFPALSPPCALPYDRERRGVPSKRWCDTAETCSDSRQKGAAMESSAPCRAPAPPRRNGTGSRAWESGRTSKLS